MYVCTYVRMYVCMYVCMYVKMNEYVDIINVNRYVQKFGALSLEGWFCGPPLIPSRPVTLRAPLCQMTPGRLPAHANLPALPCPLSGSVSAPI